MFGGLFIIKDIFHNADNVNNSNSNIYIPRNIIINNTN